MPRQKIKDYTVSLADQESADAAYAAMLKELPRFKLVSGSSKPKTTTGALWWRR